MKIERRARVGRGVFAAVFGALLLASVGCGPDCESLCNDALDLCARIEACPVKICDVPGVGCIECNDPSVQNLGICRAECDAGTDAEREAARAALDFVAQSLSNAGC